MRRPGLSGLYERRPALGEHPGHALVAVVLVLAAAVVRPGRGGEPADRDTLARVVREAFVAVHDGWSADEILVRDERARVAKHLDHSDRQSLARCLWQQGLAGVTVELHAFDPDSNARHKAMRRAYESELIHSRQPRFNLAP